MIRVPTPDHILYSWHRAMMAHQADKLNVEAPDTTHDPQCGWFLRQYGRRGQDDYQMVPASIRISREVDEETGDLLGPETLICEVGGVPRDPNEEWTWLAKRPIPREEYMRLKALDFADLSGPDKPPVIPAAKPGITEAPPPPKPPSKEFPY